MAETERKREKLWKSFSDRSKDYCSKLKRCITKLSSRSPEEQPAIFHPTLPLCCTLWLSAFNVFFSLTFDGSQQLQSSVILLSQPIKYSLSRHRLFSSLFTAIIQLKEFKGFTSNPHIDFHYLFNH